MRLRYIQLLKAGFLVIFFMGVLFVRAQVPVSVSPVEVLTPDSSSQVNVDVVFRVPEHAFTRRSRLIIVPQLMARDSLISECKPIVLDAPIYSKKMARKEKLEGYTDTLRSVVRKVNTNKTYDIPYEDKVFVPENLYNGHITAVVSTDGCGECDVVDTVPVAYIQNPPAWIHPEFVIRPKIRKGRGEALIHFIINLYDINLSLGNNKAELDKMLGTLLKVANDSLATLDSVSIYGMASADGPFGFNTTLSENRAKSAKNWLEAQLGQSVEKGVAFRIGSRPEGWMPVLEAMRADGHPDADKVADILDRYNAPNDDAAEWHIRRLACWPDIRSKYLHKDRKVEYEYTYTVKSFTTDEELLDMYGKRPDAFNEEEMLRVSTLMQTHSQKKQVYQTILRYFPESRVAKNNLAVLLFREGKSDEAEALLNSISQKEGEEKK